MAFTFPRPGSRAAEHVTPHVRECLAQPHRLPTRKDAAASAKNFCRTSTSDATGVYSMCLLGNDDIALCFFGIRGGFHVVHNFGQADR